ncbi:hypothetical protein HRJ34_14435 [Rhizorhabdus wittichii]|uniref:Uncharacterized protein n=1 Tax=Rhizorhabdus wittichii TaxID=160791 RepID=A0A975CYD6_9SPHN|nr:hypothetical protein [Rhizorhabdus wittichii]QTH19578.1 hypothetical protein HRJ34_14435 [Rhizorhabdus wittichii]
MKMRKPTHQEIIYGMTAWMGASLGLVVGIAYPGISDATSILTLLGGATGAAAAVLGAIFFEHRKSAQVAKVERGILRAAFARLSAVAKNTSHEFSTANSSDAIRLMTTFIVAMKVSIDVLKQAERRSSALDFLDMVSVIANRKHLNKMRAQFQKLQGIVEDLSSMTGVDVQKKYIEAQEILTKQCAEIADMMAEKAKEFTD